MLADVGALLEASADLPQAMARIAEWREQAETDTELQGLIWAPMAHADMAGRLFVRAIEIPHTTRSLQDEQVATFLNQPFTEAIRELERRGLIDDEGVADLVNTYRARGSEAARASLRQLQRKVERSAIQALERGSTLRDFAREVAEARAGLGFEPAAPHYVETVFRSTIQGAYGAGRFRAMTEAADVGAIEYVQRRAVGDARTRPSHLELDGKTWEARDSEWHRYSPPLLAGVFEYNCRCTSVAQDPGEVDPSLLSQSAQVSVDMGAGGAPVMNSPLDAVQAPIEAEAA